MGNLPPRADEKEVVGNAPSLAEDKPGKQIYFIRKGILVDVFLSDLSC